MTALPRDILDAMTDPAWFGRWFGGADWHPWRVFVAAVFGLPIADPADLEFFREHTGRGEAPTAPAREVYAIIGRRGGKTRTMAFIAAYLAAFVDWRPFLAPRERAEVLLLAKDRTQAGAAFRFLRSVFDHPALVDLIVSETADEITLANRVTIRVATASFRSVRSATVAACICDEAAFWFDGDASANPIEEIIGALRPTMLTTRGLLMVCSSPYAKRGPLYEARERYWGEPGRRLVWHGSTLDMHPSLADDPEAMAQIEEERLNDPAKAAAEYDAAFRDDIANYLDRDRLRALTDVGVAMRPPRPGINYAGYVDANAGGADSYGACIGHREGNLIVIDCLMEFGPGTSPDQATEHIVEVFRTYRVRRTIGDNFAKLWVQDAFTKRGIGYIRCDKSTSDVYLEAAAHFANGTVRLLDHRKSLNQLAALERRTGRVGKDSVSHPTGQHDDLATVIAGVVYQLAGKGAPIDWNRVAPAVIAQSQAAAAGGNFDATFASMFAAAGTRGVVR